MQARGLCAHPTGTQDPFEVADPLGLVNESDETNNKKGPLNMAAPADCPKCKN